MGVAILSEQERLTCAKNWILQLANGINPLDDTPIAEDNPINDVRLSRCLFYVGEVLKQVEESGVPVKVKRGKKQPFSFPPEVKENFVCSEAALSLSEFARMINTAIDRTTVKTISYKQIYRYLLSEGLLEEAIDESGKMIKRPTQRGMAVGILSEIRRNYQGFAYRAILYSKPAQQYIIDHIDQIATAATMF